LQTAKFQDCRDDDEYTPKNCTFVAQQEIDQLKPIEKWKIGALHRSHERKNFSDFKDYFSVIENKTFVVIIDAEVARKMYNNEYVAQEEVYGHAVQVYMDKMEALENSGVIVQMFPDEVGIKESLYEWKGNYDPDALGILADPSYISLKTQWFV